MYFQYFSNTCNNTFIRRQQIGDFKYYTPIHNSYSAKLQSRKNVNVHKREGLPMPSWQVASSSRYPSLNERRKSIKCAFKKFLTGGNL